MHVMQRLDVFLLEQRRQQQPASPWSEGNKGFV